MVGMDTPGMTDEAREGVRANRAGSTARVAAILFALCLVYILSIGPVAGILAWLGIGTNPRVEACAEIFYAPHKYLHDHTPLKEPLDQYIMWWIRLGARLR
jgi:hypothetical protein